MSNRSPNSLLGFMIANPGASVSGICTLYLAVMPALSGVFGMTGLPKALDNPIGRLSQTIGRSLVRSFVRGAVDTIDEVGRDTFGEMGFEDLESGNRRERRD